MPPRVPDKLPFEESVDRALDRAAAALEGSRFLRVVRRIEDKLPVIGPTEIPTPLGTVRAPQLEPPSLEPPQMDDRRKQAVKAAVAQDLAFIVGFVPVVGDAVADVVEDAYFRTIHETLTPEEFETYKKFDVYSPSTVAALRTFSKHRR
jgi:hypothetical protein